MEGLFWVEFLGNLKNRSNGPFHILGFGIFATSEIYGTHLDASVSSSQYERCKFGAIGYYGDLNRAKNIEKSKFQRSAA